MASNCVGGIELPASTGGSFAAEFQQAFLVALTKTIVKFISQSCTIPQLVQHAKDSGRIISNLSDYVMNG